MIHPSSLFGFGLEQQGFTGPAIGPPERLGLVYGAATDNFVLDEGGLLLKGNIPLNPGLATKLEQRDYFDQWIKSANALEFVDLDDPSEPRDLNWSFGDRPFQASVSVLVGDDSIAFKIIVDHPLDEEGVPIMEELARPVVQTALARELLQPRKLDCFSKLPTGNNTSDTQLQEIDLPGFLKVQPFSLKTLFQALNKNYKDFTGKPLDFSDADLGKLLQKPKSWNTNQELFVALTLFLRKREGFDESAFLNHFLKGSFDLFFPDFDPTNPVLTVPDGLSIDDILLLSISQQVAKLHIEQKMTFQDISTTKGKFTIHLIRKCMRSDYPNPKLPEITAMGKKLGLDPRMVFIMHHPWLLLLLPVVSDSGNIISKPPKTLDEGQALATRITTIQSHKINSLAYIRKLLKKRGLTPTNGLEKLGFDFGLALYIHRKNMAPSDDVLLKFIHEALNKGKLPELDARIFIEGFRRGELSYFMGILSNGSIDWSLPEGWTEERLASLDLSKISEDIAQRSGSSYRDFWFSQKHVGTIRSSDSLRSRIKHGIPNQQIQALSAIFQTHGYPELTPKVIYCHLKWKMWQEAMINS
jgi:hypothetical protein